MKLTGLSELSASVMVNDPFAVKVPSSATVPSGRATDHRRVFRAVDRYRDGLSRPVGRGERVGVC